MYVTYLGEDIRMHFSGGIYWNNVVHWLHYTGFVLCFDLEQEIIIRRIQTPFAILGLDYEDYFNNVFESRDHLLLVEISRLLSPKFKFIR